MIILLLLWYWWVSMALLSLIVTVVHSVQETVADEPIWEYLGLTRHWTLGFLGLVAFAGLQVWLALSGYLRENHTHLWILAAIRLGDVVWSHWRPWLLGRRPNPGIETAWLYLAEVVLVLGTQ